jgi:pilus assembly protein CpaE
MRVVVAQDMPGQAETIRKTLLGLGLECGAEDCVSFADLPVRLVRGPADLVLARVGPEPTPALEAIRQAGALTGAPVWALGPTSDAQHILQATRSGAAGYLDESRLPADLEVALERVRAAAGRPRPGLVVAVVAATPGSGVTTVASNLAFTWAKRQPGRVALVELGRAPADLALSLALEPRYTLADVADNWHRLDATLLKQSLTAHPGGVQVLAHEPETLDVGPLDPQVVRQMILLLRALYPVSVLDLGHLLGPEHDEAMQLADLVVVVVRLDVPSLRRARRLLQQAEESGVPPDLVHVVANRYGQRGQIACKKAEAVLGCKITQAIPEDSGRLNRALNRGEPVVRVARFAAITRRFARLAARLHVTR